MSEPMPIGDAIARLDQMRAEMRGVARLASDYLEHLEDANLPVELAHRLVVDWHREVWRAALADE